jgi:hypothetical protein
MKVSLGTVEVSDFTRRAVAQHYGLPGLAPRDLIRRFMIGEAEGALDEVSYSLQVQEEAAASDAISGGTT